MFISPFCLKLLCFLKMRKHFRWKSVSNSCDVSMHQHCCAKDSNLLSKKRKLYFPELQNPCTTRDQMNREISKKHKSDVRHVGLKKINSTILCCHDFQRYTSSLHIWNKYSTSITISARWTRSLTSEELLILKERSLSHYAVLRLALTI